jgi:hypothetical protein
MITQQAQPLIFCQERLTKACNGSGSNVFYVRFTAVAERKIFLWDRKNGIYPPARKTIRRQTVREILKILIAREEKKIELRMNKDFFLLKVLALFLTLITFFQW